MIIPRQYTSMEINKSVTFFLPFSCYELELQISQTETAKSPQTADVRTL